MKNIILYEKPAIIDQNMQPQGVTIPFAANAVVAANYICSW